ncbi:MAG: response regulator [Candidatus Omnitrophica bacterium]|nr:response regulator [Candidatus Omnitrophota bacterium]
MWNVLVVDDVVLTCKFISELLKGLAKCKIVFDGQEAIDAYLEKIETTNPYDVILMDIEMGKVDGITALKTIREHEKKSGIVGSISEMKSSEDKNKKNKGRSLKRVPVIMITAYGDYIMNAFEAGCDNFIKKPIQKKELIEKITSVIELNKKK